MIKLKKISISNFMSVGKTPIVLDLDSGLRTIIQGNNLDSDANNKSTNGVGKSSCFQAIIFSLYGKGIESKMKTDQFINLINQKKMVVELELEANNQSITIRRGRKPSFVELYVDGESLTRDSMKNTEEAIQRIIGIPYDVFMSVYFLSPHKETFMEMTPADQRSYLESVLSLDTLVERADTLKSIKKDLAMDIKLISRDLENAELTKKKAEDNVSRLEDAVRRFEDKRSATLSELEETILEASQIDFEASIDLSNQTNIITDEISALDAKIAEMKTEENDINRHNSDLKKHLTNLMSFKDKESTYLDGFIQKISKIDQELSSLHDEEYLHNQKNLIVLCNQLNATLSDQLGQKKTIESNIRSLEHKSENLLGEHDQLASGKCPYCEQEHVDRAKIEEISSKVDEIVKELEREDSALDDLMESIKQIEEQINSIVEKIDNTIDPDSELSKRESLSREREILSEKMNEPNPYADLISEIVDSVGDESSIKDSMSSIENTLNSLKLSIESTLGERSDKENSKNQLIEQCMNSVGTIVQHEIISMQSELEAIRSKIETEKKACNPYTSELEIAKEQIPDITSIKDQLDDLKKDEVHVNYLIKLLTDPKSFVRKNIVDQYVPFLNKKINEYNEKLGLSHVSEINADMSVDIQYMGRDAGYFLMSQGERLRLNLSTAMAFRDLLRLLGKDFNLVMVDEYLDSSLDGDGMYKSFNFLKAKAPNVLMISHREELCGDVDQTMIVTKQHGFSSIEIVS